MLLIYATQETLAKIGLCMLCKPRWQTISGERSSNGVQIEKCQGNSEGAVGT
jgi:hypothetical protein